MNRVDQAVETLRRVAEGNPLGTGVRSGMRLVGWSVVGEPQSSSSVVAHPTSNSKYEECEEGRRLSSFVLSFLGSMSRTSVGPLSATSLYTLFIVFQSEDAIVSVDPDAQSLPRLLISPFSHRPALDGLRGLAALAVFFYHAHTPGFERGYAGVDVFFVLTGFLLLALLGRDLAKNKRLDLVNVYFRRLRRLLPASLLVLLAAAVAHRLSAKPLTAMEHRRSFVAAALHFANYRMLWDSSDYFAEGTVSPVQHYWSLSAEEVRPPARLLPALIAALQHFHLLFPPALWVLLAFSGYRITSVGFLLSLALLCWAAVTWTFLSASSAPLLAYLGTAERFWELLAGALVHPVPLPVWKMISV